ncbi:unnamed protein product [Cylindrotheca closterium]|uniref:Uncharacterized protein n=1 Tax=Cylindrotheca closterium TaxID=2856 RepID=A0AAD2CUM9_9STRA|nr:unnamed protein product [Cylindrotheca closterium]
MMLRNDEGYQDMLHNRDEACSATKGRLSVSIGSRSKSPRVVGWKGEAVESFRPINIEVRSDENVTSPLNSATSFRSGKMFWQKLLEEKHDDVPALSPSSGSESSTSEYAEIHVTGSTVSSITDHSGFGGLKIPLKSPLSVDIPSSSTSLHSLSVSSIDNRRPSRDTNSQEMNNPPSNDDIDPHQRLSNQGMSKFGDGKKRAPSPVAYPFGMLPAKSPRFKTMSESSFESPKASFDDENDKHDMPAMGTPVIEQHLSTSWATIANENKVKVVRSFVPLSASNKKDSFKSAYSAWQRAGLMKENRDDNDHTREQDNVREQVVAPSPRKVVVSPRLVQQVTETRDSELDESVPESTQVLKGEDVVQHYKAWQRAGLMKKDAGLKSKMRLPSRQSEHPRTKPTKTERRQASGVVRKAPDTLGNPYRVWQKVGLMKSGLRNEDRQFRPSKPRALPMAPSTAANVRQVHKQKTGKRTPTEKRSKPMVLPMAPSTAANVRQVPKQKTGRRAPTEERSKPMPLPLAPSTVANVREVRNQEPFERRPIDESEDHDDEFTNILNNIRHNSDTKENSPLGSQEGSLSKSSHDRNKTECDSVSSHHRRAGVGGLSIQTASANGSTIDFFDQMREQLSPRANVRSSPASSGQDQNTLGKDELYPKSPANSSSIFRTSDSKASGHQGFEATIRAGKEKLHSWEEKSPESRNRPTSTHFQQICKSIESSDKTEGPLANLGGNRAIVLLERDNKYEVLVGQTNHSSNQQELVLKNLEVIASEKTAEVEAECDGACQCSQSIFSGNDNLIDFFLPQMGMACTCREQHWKCANPDDPTAIENVLRPWQVQFLHRFGITHAEELVKARHRSVGILGKAMRQWRIKEGMQTFRTSSCIMALDIWSKTCKAYVRSIRKQLGTKDGPHGTREMPRTLIPQISKFLMENPPAQTPQKSFDTILA